MAEESKVLRRKLKVVSLGEPKPIGKGTKHPFNAVDIASGKETDFEHWSKSFEEHIKVGAEIDVDIEFSQTGQGGEYKHRKIIQIYKDGKPVAKSLGGYSGGGMKRDEDRTDARTAIMCITDLAKEGKLEEFEASKSPLAMASVIWCKVAIHMTVSDKKKA